MFRSGAAVIFAISAQEAVAWELSVGGKTIAKGDDPRPPPLQPSVSVPVKVLQGKPMGKPLMRRLLTRRVIGRQGYE
jgi:hypothetical protein